MSHPETPIKETLKQQSRDTVADYEKRMNHVIGQFGSQGLNAAPYYKNKDFKKCNKKKKKNFYPLFFFFYLS